MQLQVRKLQESDWDFIPKWWEAYGSEGFPRDFLPGAFQIGDEQEKKREGLGGFMVCKGNDPIAAMWLWMTNSKMAIPAVVVSDKSYRDSDRSDALQLLINFTTDFAKDLGYNYSIAFSEENNLLKKYKKAEYEYNKTPFHKLILKY